jgi:hypothetical protein
MASETIQESEIAFGNNDAATLCHGSDLRVEAIAAKIWLKSCLHKGHQSASRVQRPWCSAFPLL